MEEIGNVRRKLFVAILNKQKCHFFFFFSENRSAKQILRGMEVYQWNR
jgi:hypothetical protein